MAMQRVQMLLEPRQRRKLAELAKAQKKSVAEIARNAIDLGLEQIEMNDRQARLLEALEAARKLRDSMPMLDVDIVADLHEMREERDNELLRSD